MRVERAVQPKPDRVWMVAQWKYELDLTVPWWQRAFFRYCYRPFVHLAFKRFKIPAVKGAEIEGNKTTFFWFENAGFFSSEDAANLACTSKFHGYKDVPLDRQFPPETAQYSSLVFPRQRDSRQHRKQPTLNLVVTPRERLEQLQREIDKLRQVLHQ